MPKTTLTPERKVAIEKQFLGRIIIFCEGMTEKLYLDYFANIINKKNKYTDIKIETESANGNSRKVFNFANNFMESESNNRKYINYTKYLIFDCDSPKDIQSVINDMIASTKEYNLLVSNFLFEVWLLMHFEIVDSKMSKKKIYEKLGIHLANDYVKANAGTIREIIRKGSVEDAIKNAQKLYELHESAGNKIENNIKDMNPYTNVHKLLEQFMLEIS
ncbi:RloB domain-containing protein [Ruminiclostridium herbifermentans]|uniref:RloB domain-containing protein n=1 Tax=Ruminiclostridium herbifermentans TaxID=2488810 RepID=A0A4U7JH98_9FIRM|nr:RloB family protein [Ruminiclostridium herbifermentans]QNU67419.1 RloB domain-containing protein [Ruminiclostridium herbifermentans]